MHLRRRFAEALILIGRKDLPEEAIQELPESQALKLIGEIYAAEKPLKEVPIKERTIRRNTEVRPKVDAFFSFVNGIDIETPEMSEKLKLNKIAARWPAKAVAQFFLFFKKGSDRIILR